MQSIGKAFILFTAVVLLVTVAQASPFGLPAGSIHNSLESRLHSGASYSAPQVSISDSALGRYGIGNWMQTTPSAPSTSLQGACAFFPGTSSGQVQGEISPGITETASTFMDQNSDVQDTVVLLQLTSGSVVGFGNGGLISYWAS